MSRPAAPDPSRSGLDRLEISVLPSFSEVDPAAWDALVPPDDPFCTHAFLHTLEASGSATADTGWLPAPVLVHRADGTLVGGAPAWLKGHSYGEYIFDWGWARACERAGIPYYPKVTVAVPFTPATGRRLLVHPAPGGPEGGPTLSQDAVEHAILEGLRHLADAGRASGIHLLFTTAAEHARIPAAGPFLGRVTQQFHWTNAGYTDFDHWLSTFRAKCRKETRRERRRVAELGATLRVIEGPALGPREWGALERFYRLTCEKKWGEAYLTPDFFALAPETLAALAIGLLVEKDGEYVAGALAFQRGRHLYGRYWGCLPGHEALHFEVCYHRPIELCIARGWTRFEAGAQGGHKLRRGLLPAETYSSHWLRHGGLAAAVQEAVEAETAELRAQLPALAHHGPFKRD